MFFSLFNANGLFNDFYQNGKQKYLKGGMAMPRKLAVVLFALLLIGLSWGTEVTYQGKLTDSTGVAVNGDVDIILAIYTNVTGTTLVTVDTSTVTCTNGLFSGIFDLTISSSVLSSPSTNLYYEVSVDLGGGYTKLTPRKLITAEIKALWALNATYALTAGSALSANSALNADHAAKADSADYADEANYSATAGVAAVALYADSTDWSALAAWADAVLAEDVVYEDSITGLGDNAQDAIDNLYADMIALPDADELVKVGDLGTPDWLNENFFAQDATNHITIKYAAIGADQIADEAIGVDKFALGTNACDVFYFDGSAWLVGQLSAECVEYDGTDVKAVLDDYETRLALIESGAGDTLVIVGAGGTPDFLNTDFFEQGADHIVIKDKSIGVEKFDNGVGIDGDMFVYSSGDWTIGNALATKVDYDNSMSGLAGTTVQKAIDELAGVTKSDSIWSADAFVSDTIVAMANFKIHSELIADSIQAVGDYIDLDDNVNVWGDLTVDNDLYTDNINAIGTTIGIYNDVDIWGKLYVEEDLDVGQDVVINDGLYVDHIYVDGEDTIKVHDYFMIEDELIVDNIEASALATEISVNDDVDIWGDLYVDGKLTIDGGIDPTYLALTPQATSPFPIASGDPGIWVDNTDKKLYYYDGSGQWQLNTEYTAGDGLSITDHEFSVNVDDVTIEIVADVLQVKDGGISTDKLADDAVTTPKIMDDAVTTVKLDDGSVTTDKIAADAVTNAKIADDAISTVKIRDEAVTSDKIAYRTIDKNDMATGSITSRAIEDGSIQSDDIDDAQIISRTIATGAVTSIKILDGTIKPEDLETPSTGGAGTVFRYDGSDWQHDFPEAGDVEFDNTYAGAIITETIVQGAIEELDLRLGDEEGDADDEVRLTHDTRSAFLSTDFFAYEDDTTIIIKDDGIGAEQIDWGLGTGEVDAEDIPYDHATYKDVDAALGHLMALSSAWSDRLDHVVVVAKNGDDTSADGSQKAPFKTIAKAIDYGVNTASWKGSDFIVYLMPGTYNEQVLIDDDNIHIIGIKPEITIITYDGAYAVKFDGVDGAQLRNLTVKNGSSTGYTILIDGSKNIELKDVYAYSDGASAGAAALRLDGTSPDVMIRGGGYWGDLFGIYSNPSSGDAKIIIMDSRIYGKNDDALYLDATEVELHSGELSNDDVADREIYACNGSKVLMGAIKYDWHNIELVGGSTLEYFILQDSIIVTNMIAPDAVTTEKIANDQITLAKMANNAVASAEIVNYSIIGDDIHENAITGWHVDDHSLLTVDIGWGYGSDSISAKDDSKRNS